jgi:hypothetical protein
MLLLSLGWSETKIAALGPEMGGGIDISRFANCEISPGELHDATAQIKAMAETSALPRPGLRRPASVSLPTTHPSRQKVR